MAIDAFIKFEGPNNKITGESQDGGFKASDGWSSVQTVSFGATQTTNIGTSTSGAGAGKVFFSDFTITKEVDNASPTLFLALCSGSHYETVTIAIRKSTGSNTAVTSAYLQYTFKLVLVSSIATSLATGNDVPQESISYAYGAMQIQYSPQDSTGKLGTANPGAWSRITNTNTLNIK